MSTTVQIILLGLVILTAVSVLRLVRRRRLRGKYVLLWFGACLAMVPAALFPDEIDDLVVDLGVDYPPTAYLLTATVFLFAVVVHMSWELSRLDERTRTLAEELALLRGDMEHGSPHEQGANDDDSASTP
ncbi:MAG: DUF2304 domain-containing protein [Acidimicrobiales bacterium]